jgi:multidrug resistance efflux pump
MKLFIKSNHFKYSNMKRIITVIVLLVLLAACDSKDKTAEAAAKTVNPDSVQVREVIGIGKVEPENEIVNLAATSGGIVTAILKKDGDTVKMGELLVQLDDATEQIKVKQVRSQISTQQTQVDIEGSNLKNNEVSLVNKKRQLATAKALLEKGAETREAFDDLVTAVRSLEVDIEKSTAVIRQAKDRIAELYQQLKLAETEAGQKKIKSPYNGIMLDMQIAKGAAIDQYATFAEFAPEGRTIIRAEVDELFADRLATGQKVDVRYTGNAKVIAQGELMTISPYLKKKSLFSVKADDQEDRRVREIRVSLNNNTPLVINSKVECIIKIQP